MLNKLIQLTTPLPKEFSANKANCFNAVMWYFDRSTKFTFCGPEEFVRYVQDNFSQVNKFEAEIGIIWSRSHYDTLMDPITVDQLKKESPGYPFGLVIEHAFVYLEGNLIFQKRNPSELGPYEIITFDEAVRPYLEINGFELTFHK